MLKNVFKMLIVSIFVTIFLPLINIPLDNYFPAIVFAVCGIFFSVGMSQIMAYDISKILNDTYFHSIKKSLNSIRKSFVMQFVFCIIAYLGYEILTEYKEIKFVVTIKGFNFSLIQFLNVILVYCLIYFVINFQELLKNKLELDSKIRQENLDE